MIRKKDYAHCVILLCVVSLVLNIIKVLVVVSLAPALIFNRLMLGFNEGWLTFGGHINIIHRQLGNIQVVARANFPDISCYTTISP